ncbi:MULTISPECIES: flagellar motor switch protein FliG [Dactylosporangium]|uniref:Flagellar motor switch protein FliG n=2 Tax=Dactylosporangium TaxID=35753 RepID=A0A9W6KUK0_9ACTN|nr:MULTISPECIES: flagellar motor switch protein FliG [Dactylosporangium]UAB95487.1 flagellar motor switch protein FliG [Dactylosporangium vinaceum]UWZ43806.1 flagellar motor switch protein FliG [Dactylosporangium matsuzakiense]GLL07943.1 flagellar motor switch protein FliG [Dactylosporangium matsuzakiense]
MTTGEMTGLRKAAVLLVQMGKEEAAKIMAHLRESEVEELTAEIVRLGQVEADVANVVLEEFHDMATGHKYVGQGGMDFARDLLEASLGRERAGEIVGRLNTVFLDVPFGFLGQADPRQLLSFLQDEHPQTIALVLAHMTATQASQILSGLAPELQADVAHRIAVMDRTSPDIIRQVEATLERKMSSVLQPNDLSNVGGLEPLVEIINRTDRATERLILEGLAGRNPELAEEIRSKMFMFEDIVSLDDRSIQLVLRQVETNDLATALKGVREEVRQKVMKNLSERAAENLADEIEMLGPVRLRQVEESQAKIVQAIRTLEESGQIVISRGDDDEMVG